MHLRRFSLVLSFVLLAPGLWAHVDEARWASYQIARKHYAASDYVAAKAMLAPLVQSETKDAITPYVLFYYALSAYYNGEQALAEDTFTNLAVAFPAWEQQEEVSYWLGQLRFEAQDYSTGLAHCAKIKSKAFAEPLKQLKAFFLRQLDIAALQALLSQYPEEQVIAQVLLDKVAQQPWIRRDADLLYRLTRDFHLVLQNQDPLKGVPSLKKERYNVGVFLPFFVDEVDYEEDGSNQFVIALYQGIKVAVAALAEQGIEINLFAYDTKKDPATTAALLEQEEVKGMDLIIGPLYAATIPLVADFARAHRINLFNPLSENAEVVGDNPFVFLWKPSLETQARRAAEFTLQRATEGFSVGIVYSTSEADGIRAHAYKQHIERSAGQEVALMFPIAPEEAPNFLHKLRGLLEGDARKAREEDDAKAALSLASLTHIYVASKNELITANVLSAVEILKLNPCIIGYEAWLQRGALTLDQLQRLQLYLLAPDHIDYEREGIYAFRNHFYDMFTEYPSYYACVGYELMLFLGRMLAEHGVYFQQHWGEQSYSGAIFEGVAYGVHHDNQQVSVVQLQDARFVICHQEATSD